MIWTEDRLRRLPPTFALGLLLVPMLLLFPVKIAGLWMIATGRFMTGCPMMLVAKILGTAIVARIFLTCRAQLMALRWFALLYEWLLVVRDAVHLWMSRQPAWHRAKRAVRHARALIRAWMRGKSHARVQAEGGFKRGALMRWRSQRRVQRTQSSERTRDGDLP